MKSHKIRTRYLYIGAILAIITLSIIGCLRMRMIQPYSGPLPKVTAWIAFWDWNRGIETIDAHPGMFSEVFPFWYDMDSTGRVFYAQGMPRPGAASRPLSMNEKRFVKYCHARGIKVLPLISNEFDKKRTHAVLNDDTIRRRHIDNILALVDKYDYDGIDIDYEGMLGIDREPFSRFMKELSDELHQRGKLLSAAVHAKFSEPGSWDANIAHDYKSLGQSCDRIRIMAYDHHYSGGEPGCIAPTDWMEDILKFAVTQIPPEKIYFGVGIYGINWGKPKDTEGMYTTAMRLSQKYNTPVNWDEKSQENWFTFTDPSTGNQRTVWFFDARSFAARWEMIKKYHIGGVSLWRIGGEDPAMWKMIEEDRRK